KVIVNLRRGSDHATVKEHVEGRRLQILLGQSTRTIVLPENGEQQRRDNGIDVDAEHVARRAGIIKRLDKLTIEGVEDVKVAAFLDEPGDKAFAWIVVDGLALEDRVVHAGQCARPIKARLLRLRLLLLVRFGKACRHRLEIEAVIAIGWIPQVGVLELLQQERHALETIATMAVPAMG